MTRLFTFLLLLGFFSSAQAQQEWDLEGCVNYAIQNSIDVYQFGLSVKDAEIQTKLSEQERYPNLNFNTSANLNFGRTVDPTTDLFVTATFFSTGYSLTSGVLLYDGGRMNNSIQQNKWNEKAALADQDNMKHLLTLDVVRAYFEILFAEDSYDNSAIQLKTINDQIDQMRKLVNAGSRAQYEILDLEAQQATFEQDLTIAQNRIDIAYLSLKGLLNLPSDFDITIAPPPVEQEVVTDIDLVTIEEVFSKALDFQPAARGLDYQIESAYLGVKVAESAFYPTISFGGSASTNFSNQAKEVAGFTDTQFNSDVLINGNPAIITTEQPVPTLVGSPYFNQVDNNFSFGFGVNVAVPIYQNYFAKGGQQRAQLNLQNLQAEKDKNSVELKNSLMQLLTDARAAKRSLEASEKTMNARDVAFQNANKRFELGAINSYDYISIQDELNTAKINFIISKYDFMLKSKVLDYFQGYPVSLK